MRIIYEYSHLGGSEILQVRFQQIKLEIDSVIKDVVASKTKLSREKSMKDKKLFSPKDMNSQFKNCFNGKGFSELKDRYTIEIPDYPKKIPNAFKQIDFVKEKVLVEVQFGKYAFMFYDMAKFQYFFNENKAEVGVEIVPCHNLQSGMSTGVAFGEQLVYDIERLKRHFPAVPLKIILIDADFEEKVN